MTYSEKARALRRCQAQTKSGQPCRQYALWGDARQVCAVHGGRTRGPDLNLMERLNRLDRHDRHAHYPACQCRAYAWPHRPGGGLCRWPDPPRETCAIPAGSHRRWRLRRH